MKIISTILKSPEIIAILIEQVITPGFDLCFPDD